MSSQHNARSERDWLLIKERDGWARTPGDDLAPESVLSGLTVEDLKSGRTPAEVIRAELGRLGERVVRGVVDPASVPVMLAETREEAFSRPDWIYELKLDGYRLLAANHYGEARLLTRSGNDFTEVFPEIARAVRALPVPHLVLDGEVVVLDGQGRPSFALLQRRGRISRPLDVKRAAVELPATYFAFDLLGFEDFDLRGLPLRERKELLRLVLPRAGPLRFCDHVEVPKQ